MMVSAAEISNEPRQPSRFEKNRNMVSPLYLVGVPAESGRRCGRTRSLAENSSGEPRLRIGADSGLVGLGEHRVDGRAQACCPRGALSETAPHLRQH